MAGSNSYTRSFYDGEDRVAEFYGDERSLLVVHGPGPSTGSGQADEPLITYDDVNGARYLYADERGSIIAGASDAGTVDRVYAYDEFGIISAPRRNRFEFTGHIYELVSGLLYARGRFYNRARPLHAGRPDRLRRRHEHVRPDERRSGELRRPLGAGSKRAWL
jgi:hypothetical protein